MRDDRNSPTANSAIAANELLREMRIARQNLPWHDLPSDAQTKIRSVVSGTPLFHRMPQQSVYADPEIYHFLIRHPTVVIGFWEQLGCTQISLQEVRGNVYYLRETGGTNANVEILYRSDTLAIAHVRGEYRGPLLAKAYPGSAVLVLRMQETKDETGEPMIVCDLDVFVHINSLGADMLAKLFFSTLTKVADSNFAITISFVSQVSRATVQNNQALQNTAGEIASICPEVLAEFCEVTDRIAMRYASRNRLDFQQRPVQQRPVQQRTAFPIAASQPPGAALPSAESRSNRTEYRNSGTTAYSTPPEHWNKSEWTASDWAKESEFAKEKFVDSPIPPYTAIRQQSAGGLSVPRSLVSNPARHIIPKLPSR